MYTLPPLDTETLSPAGLAWLDELDFIDPIFGPIETLQALCHRAPTATLESWLEIHIAARIELLEQLDRINKGPLQ